jgi:uncharacterized protein
MASANVLANANVYIDGRSFVGQAKSVELPEIELEMAEFEALGLFGTPELVVGIQPLEATIEWSSFYPDLAKVAADFSEAVKIELRGSVEEFNTQGRSSVTPYKVMMRATFKKNPMGSFTQKEMAEFESELSVYYIKQSFGSEVLLEVDVFNNIYKTAGKDLLSKFRSNLGL